MFSDLFFSPTTFAWTITALLMVGALLPKARRLLRNWADVLWRAPLLLIILAGGYAMALGGVYLATPSQELRHTVWLHSAWAPNLPALSMELGLDSLAAFFLLLVGFFALLVAIYSMDALTADHYRPYRAYIVGGYSVFVWGSLMTILAYDVFSLLIILEITTLAFATLSLFKMQAYRRGLLHGEAQQRQEARLAPKVYLIISHASTAFLLLGFLLLAAPAHSLSFQVLQARAADGALTVFQNQAAFILLLIGLGIRAGFTPAHIWPPLVHPASPTTTHAFSLGMGIKVALFLMIRVFFQLLSPAPWWGLLLFLLAGVTAITNVWYALNSHDLKTALAYHSIENIGIMTAGIGLSLYAYAHGANNALYALAGLAMAAGLFHLVNHAIFKSLLYLATGAIENLTHGQVHMARLGGLLRFYPLTGLFFLAGAWAITGFPPFNGFISEWMTIKANMGMLIIYATPGEKMVLWRELFILLIGFLLLITSFALTAACFYKIAGLTLFGGRREREVGWEMHDVSPWMTVPMGLLAASALALGLFSTPMRILLDGIVRSLGLPAIKSVGVPVSWGVNKTPIPILSIPLRPSWGVALLFLAVLIAIPFLLARRGQRHHLAWQGGVDDLSPDHIQPTGVSLTWLIRKQFRYLSPNFVLRRAFASARGLPAYLPDIIRLADKPPISDSSQSKETLPAQGIVEVFRYAANFLIHKTFTWSERFAITVQNGDVRRYMTYIGITYLGVLILYMLFAFILLSK